MICTRCLSPDFHPDFQTKAVACAGTAQTRDSRCGTLTAGLVFNWWSPFWLLPGLLGPAYGAVRNSGERNAWDADSEHVWIMISEPMTKAPIIVDPSTDGTSCGICHTAECGGW